MQIKSEMTEIASKTLGDSTSYAVYTSEYDPTLLNPMPRALARNENKISVENFDGFDVWHCYEATFLTDKGHPVSGILKIVYPADTENMVESKSMKLFLNSFDMCKLGTHVRSAIPNYISAVRDSIAKCLGDIRVEVNFFRHVDILRKDVTVFENPLVENADYYDICERNELNDINDIYNQINSMRETNEFHEFCAERLFVEIDKNSTNSVIVALLYTRRGSLDINPVRYSKNIQNVIFKDYIKNMVDVNVLTLPTIIQ